MKLFISTLLVLMMVQISSAQTKTKSNVNTDKYGVAISGFDAVAYFTSGKAVEGNKKFAISYDGAVFYFSSQENLNKFNKTPSAFAPAYGGWCAFAMGDSGDKVKIDPYTFKILDGKLYLFYNFYFTNTLDSWNKNEKKLKSNADLNWNKLINTK